MDKKLRTINIVEGSTTAGKTRQLLKEYREVVKHTSAIFLSFEDNLTSKIPAEEINAHIGYHMMSVGAYQSLDELVDKLNEIIDQRKIHHIFIDTIEIAIYGRRYTPTQYYSGLHDLTSSVTISIQLPRHTHVNNS